MLSLKSHANTRSNVNDEPKDPKRMRLRKHNKNMKCKRCGGTGHNKNTCIGNTPADRAIPVGGNKVSQLIPHSTVINTLYMLLTILN